MSRNQRDRSARVDSVRASGFDADRPAEGFYRFRLRSGGMLVGVRIWWGPPLDPVTGEELDRSHRWNAAINGRPVDLGRVWPACGREPSTAEEYAFLSAQQTWGERHAPDAPQADPTRRVDALSSPILF